MLAEQSADCPVCRAKAAEADQAPPPPPAPPRSRFLRKAAWAAACGVFLIWLARGFARLHRESHQGNIHGRLAGIRSALSIYYGDHNGRYPAELKDLTIGKKYLTAWSMRPPRLRGCPFSDARYVYDVHSGTAPDGLGGWFYDNVPGDANYGMVMVDCTGTDTRGSAWTSY